MATPDTIRLYGTATDSIVDGPGLRHAIFVQGCPHRCEGCHNPKSWDFDGGTLRLIDEVVAEVQANKLVCDVTISGGEPFAQAQACAALVTKLRDAGYGIWIYSGYRYEDLCARSEGKGAEAEAVAYLLDTADVLVDGPFKQDLRSLDIVWRGSSNQRVIDLKKTRRVADHATVVLWEAHDEFPTKPPSW